MDKQMKDSIAAADPPATVAAGRRTFESGAKFHVPHWDRRTQDASHTAVLDAERSVQEKKRRKKEEVAAATSYSKLLPPGYSRTPQGAGKYAYYADDEAGGSTYVGRSIHSAWAHYDASDKGMAAFADGVME